MFIQSLNAVIQRSQKAESLKYSIRKRNVEELARLRYKHIHILPLNRIAAVFFPCIRINRFFS